MSQLSNSQCSVIVSQCSVIVSQYSVIVSQCSVIVSQCSVIVSQSSVIDFPLFCFKQCSKLHSTYLYYQHLVDFLIVVICLR